MRSGPLLTDIYDAYRALHQTDLPAGDPHTVNILETGSIFYAVTEAEDFIDAEEIVPIEWVTAWLATSLPTG